MEKMDPLAIFSFDYLPSFVEKDATWSFFMQNPYEK
jgi:hypothetical protein